MQVTFRKLDDGRLCGWTASPPHRKPFQGTTMAAGAHLPHDLAQFVVERELRLERGFWGLLAAGASFKTVPGRKMTEAGRRLVRDHRVDLDKNEGIVNAQVHAWRRGVSTPAGAALDAMLSRWRALAPDQELLLQWSIKPARPSKKQLLRRRE
jgi:hypothetical protein